VLSKSTLNLVRVFSVAILIFVFVSTVFPFWFKVLRHWLEESAKSKSPIDQELPGLLPRSLPLQLRRSGKHQAGHQLFDSITPTPIN
jgi:hypothetical protein